MAYIYKLSTLLLFMFFTASSYANGKGIKIDLGQRDLTSISKFNQQIVIELTTTSSDTNFPIWTLDRKKGKLSPFLDTHGYPVISTFSNRTGSLEAYASRNGNAVFINFPKQTERNKLVRIDKNQAFKIAANERFTYLISERQIVLLTKSRTEIIPLDVLDVESLSILPRDIAITEDNLYLAYHSKWSGGLYELSINAKGTFSKNHYLSGYRYKELALDSKSQPWAIGSRPLISDYMHYFGKKKFSNILHATAFSKYSLPNELVSSGDIELTEASSFNGIIITENDETISTSFSGIFSIKDRKALNYLWKGKLHDVYSYTDPHLGMGVSKRSFPIGLVEIDGNLFTATESRGVLEFSPQKNGKYVLTKTYPIE